MSDVTAFVRREVDLQNYSASPNFFGYFQHLNRGVATQEVVQQAVTHFDSSLYLALPLELVTSLFTDVDELKAMYELTDETIEKRVIPLAKIGWLNLINYSEHDETAWKNLENSLRSFPLVNDADTSLLNSTMMTVPGINGHCFFVNERSGLIIYPHEDIGFGILADKQNEGYRVAENFLKTVPSDYFEVSVKKS